MRVVLLANKSVHTQRWSAGLLERGYDVHVVTIDAGGLPLPDNVPEHFIPASKRAAFPVAALRLRRLLRSLRPDLLHAHQAFHYGALARLSRFHPTLLSVWGFDVYDWPAKSRLHERIVRGNLAYADAVCATSHAMAAQLATLGLDPAHVHITPFGVDVDRFQPSDPLRGQTVESPPVKGGRVVTVGTVKTLASKYGIDILLRAFAIARNRLGDGDGISLVMRISGGGPEAQNLARLARSLGIDDAVEWLGQIPNDRVPDELNRLDVYVAVSRDDSESFGVAILEASACGLPVVVSEVGGLPEVVEAGANGTIVPREDPESTADAILRYAADPELRARVGAAGRRRVCELYPWSRSLDIMEDVYERVVSS